MAYEPSVVGQVGAVEVPGHLITSVGRIALIAAVTASMMPGQLASQEMRRL